MEKYIEHVLWYAGIANVRIGSFPISLMHPDQDQQSRERTRLPEQMRG